MLQIVRLHPDLKALVGKQCTHGQDAFTPLRSARRSATPQGLCLKMMSTRLGDLVEGGVFKRNVGSWFRRGRTRAGVYLILTEFMIIHSESNDIFLLSSLSDGDTHEEQISKHPLLP
jgi:hypothetical protein